MPGSRRAFLFSVHEHVLRVNCRRFALEQHATLCVSRVEEPKAGTEQVASAYQRGPRRTRIHRHADESEKIARVARERTEHGERINGTVRARAGERRTRD